MGMARVQDYNQVVDRIAEKTKKLAEMKKKELGDRVADKLRQSTGEGEHARKEKEREEARRSASRQIGD